MKKEILKSISIVMITAGILTSIGGYYTKGEAYFFLILSIIGLILFFYASSKK